MTYSSFFPLKEMKKRGRHLDIVSDYTMLQIRNEIEGRPSTLKEPDR